MKTYKFSNSKVIKEIQLIFGEYDSHNDCSTNTIRIFYRNNTEVSWQSAVINGGDIAVSENGNYVYAENRIKGIYCFETKTGKQLWHNRHLAFHIIPNGNGTVTCNYLKSIFILSYEGKIAKEIKSNQENAIKYLGDNCFLFKANSKTFKIVKSENLEAIYEISSNVFKDSIRFASKNQDILSVTYWNNTTENVNLKNYKLWCKPKALQNWSAFVLFVCR